MGVEAKTEEKTETPEIPEAGSSKVEPSNDADTSLGDDIIDLTESNIDEFETLDEYKHVDDDDVILIEDGHPVGSKKSKTEIVKEAEAKLKAEKEREEKRKAAEEKRAVRNAYYKRLLERRDGDLNNLPPRDVESLQCEWVVMDRALEVCPQFAKVRESTLFQEHLNKFLQHIGKKSEEAT